MTGHKIIQGLTAARLKVNDSTIVCYPLADIPDYSCVSYRTRHKPGITWKLGLHGIQWHVNESTQLSPGYFVPGSLYTPSDHTLQHYRVEDFHDDYRKEQNSGSVTTNNAKIRRIRWSTRYVIYDGYIRYISYIISYVNATWPTTTTITKQRSQHLHAAIHHRAKNNEHTQIKFPSRHFLNDSKWFENRQSKKTTWHHKLEGVSVRICLTAHDKYERWLSGKETDSSR